MNKKQFYKVVCSPPKDQGGNQKVYKASSKKEAENIERWFLNVEWEAYNASCSIVPITEIEWKSIR